VHDELVLEVRASEEEAVGAAVRERMAGAAQLRVPLRVEIGTGKNWDEAH
jgi:DNA polymerase I